MNTKEIVDLEKSFWNAMIEKDLSTALSLTDFPCVLASSHGTMSVDSESFTKMLQDENSAIEAYELDESKAKVRFVGEDTAVIAYDVRTVSKMNGKRKTTDAVDTSTWIKKNGKWMCAMHTETEKAPH